MLYSRQKMEVPGKYRNVLAMALLTEYHIYKHVPGSTYTGENTGTYCY
jgi:hypothetical protein